MNRTYNLYNLLQREFDCMHLPTTVTVHGWMSSPKVFGEGGQNTLFDVPVTNANSISERGKIIGFIHSVLYQYRTLWVCLMVPRTGDKAAI